MAIPVLNASGCLDPLTAPDVARALDVVVTKEMFMPCTRVNLSGFNSGKTNCSANPRL